MRLTLPLTLAMLAVSPLVQADEQVVLIDGSSRQIPATITLPEGAGPFPFVVMFHGTGSNRHEAGNGYDLLAPKLSEAGIASARFDFAGNGDSTADYMEYTLTSGMDDGLDVIAYMRGLPQIDGDRLGLLGWSQGGTVAMLTSSRTNDVLSVVIWAGAIDMSGFAAAQYDEAVENGFAVVEFGWRSALNVSLEWFNEVREIDIAAELGNYSGALLAISGSEDTVVVPETADQIVNAAASKDKAIAIIEGADHTFNIFTGDMSAFEELMDVTVTRFQQTL